MTSREIVIKLIDDHLIDGEQAFTLINDLVQSELVDSMKVLTDCNSKKDDLWTPLTTYTGYSTTTTPVVKVDPSGSSYTLTYTSDGSATAAGSSL